MKPMKNQNLCFRYLQQHFQTNKKSIFLLLVFGPHLVPIGPHLVPCGPRLVPFDSHLVPTWSHLVPTWPPLGPTWDPWSNLGSYLVPTRSHFGLHLVPLGPTLVSVSPHLVSVSSHLVPIWSQLGGSSGVLGSRKASKTSEESTLFDFCTHLGLWPSWGRLGGFLEVSWAIFGAYLDVLGASWRVLERLARCLRVVLGWTWGVFRACLGILWRLGTSWRRLGAVLGHLGGVLRRLGCLLGRLGASWGVLGRLGDRLWALAGLLGRLEPFSACPRNVSETSWLSKPTPATQNDAKRLFTLCVPRDD